MRQRRDWWDIAGLCTALAVLVALAVWPRAALHPIVTPDTAELLWLQQRYGPGRHSMWGEEWIIRDFFADRREGVFVDVGAGHYEQYSNTYYLETGLGWSGLAIDAQRDLAAGYREHRPRTRFDAAFVADHTGETAKLFLSPDNWWVASGSEPFTERWGRTSAIDVPTVTLDDLLQARRLSHFDFLNIDIELGEPKALAGFTIGRFRPDLVCIEAHPEVRQAILDYFSSHEYVVVGKYLRVDTRNLYFMPAGHTVKPFPSEVMRQWTYHPRSRDH